jgi:hypothetical protein
MRSDKLGPEWRPDRARFALTVTPNGHLAACVIRGGPRGRREAGVGPPMTYAAYASPPYHHGTRADLFGSRDRTHPSRRARPIR